MGLSPETAAMGPMIQVAVGSWVAEATGSELGQVHEAVFTVGSFTLIGLRATSPVFSTTKR